MALDDDDRPVSSPPLRPPLANLSAPRDAEPPALDADKLLKWQQQRLERKLRGEYESVLMHMQELITGNLDSPLRVASIRVEGAPKTRRSFLQWLTKPYMTPAGAEASTVASVLDTTRHIAHILKQTDIFSSVDAQLKASRDPLARDEDVQIVFKTCEKGRYFLKTATEFGDNEGSASIQARIRNVFGGAETFDASLSLGTTTRKAFHASLSAPLTTSLKTRGEILAFAADRDYTSFASCIESARGIKAAVRTETRRGFHEFAYEAVLRHIGQLESSASLSIRETAGHNIKSAVSHTWQHDMRNHRVTATEGVYLRTFQELAGLGGEAAYLKTNNQASFSWSLLSGSTLSVSARAGLLWPLTSRPAHFSDRFHLGGPGDVRMFRQNSMGPRDGTDSLGGDLYWAAGLSLISDFPRRPQWPLKTHLFLNAGRLDGLDHTKPLLQNAQNCLTTPSVSAGIGLLYHLEPVRVELNLGVPLLASRSDGHRRGFQFGIGLDFL